MAEREQCGYSGAVVEPVPDVQTLAVLHLAWHTREVAVRCELGHMLGDALGEPTTGFGVAEQDVHCCCPAGLATEPALEDCVDSRGPREVHDSAVVEHDDDRGRRRSDRLDDANVIGGQVE